MMPFAEYAPDLPAFENPGSNNIVNVLPHLKSYKPHPSLAAYSGILNSVVTTARCQGAVAARGADGTTYIYAGDSGTSDTVHPGSGRLFVLDTGSLSWTNVSRTSAVAYSPLTDGAPGWRFQQFGNKLVAVNFVDDTQLITLGGANFAALGGTPPRAKYITGVRNRIVMAYTFDGTDGSVPFRVRWSGLTTAGLGDETSWAVSGTTTADFQDLPGDAGAVHGIFGGEYGVVLQEKAVTRMTFSGGGLVFQFDRIEGVRGTPAPGSAIQYEDFVYYLGEDGFYAFDGTHSSPIGANRVDKTFFAEVDQSYLFRITCAADPINKLIYWYYPGSGSSSGTPNKGLIYDTVNNKWASVSGTELEILVSAYTVGVTLDNMDALFGTNMDSHPFSLDSAVWVGGRNQFAAFTTDHKLGFWNGSNMAATLDTAEFQPYPGKRAFVTGARPLVDGGTTTITAIHRTLPTASVTTDSAVAVNSDGRCPLRVNDRYHRFRASIAAGGSWSHAQGIEVEARPEGRR